ncbi:MAG: hypothetical protein CMO06_12830 [Thalassospira sp.]|uniref:O-antigen ligase family protein n=1 Tax=Thalassospira sp. TaxID=1912094 RepID=UPI000C5D9B62|nr:O-antigen ligase family protein [Thalassospira sp.]MAZ34021.1 hypothetical protein [Thalassospira sp.]
MNMVPINATRHSNTLSAHFFGLMWFVNLCSPYINIALNRPDVPSLLYASVMGGMVICLMGHRRGIVLRISRLGLVGGVYLLYTVFYALAFGTRQESWGFLVQGGSVLLAMVVFGHPREYRIIFTWLTIGMAGFGAFLIWQSITGYKPPWLMVRNFLHDVGGYIRGGEGFGEKNYSAALLTAGFVFAWTMAVYKQMPRWCAYTALVGCSVGVLFTFSRGAFVAFGVILICYALTSSRRFAKLLLVGGGLVPVAMYFMGDALQLAIGRFSLSSTQDVMQASSRLDQVAGAMDMLASSGSLLELFFGRGPFVYVNTIIIHNIPLGILVEQGVLGLLLWIWMMFVTGQRCLAFLRNGFPYPLMAFAGFLVAGMLIRIEVERNFWLLLLFVHGFSYLLPQSSKSQPYTMRSRSHTCGYQSNAAYHA